MQGPPGSPGMPGPTGKPGKNGENGVPVSKYSLDHTLKHCFFFLKKEEKKESEHTWYNTGGHQARYYTFGEKYCLRHLSVRQAMIKSVTFQKTLILRCQMAL